MLPFYIYYSMFGFQRVGDLAWAAGDSRARGFLVGATAGRTTLNGEGLQHEDGHSHLMAGAIPNCRAYDPTFSYEIAVILQDGVRRMLKEQEDVYYYVTVMNENYAHPDMPRSDEPGRVEADIIKGMYLFRDSGFGVADSGKAKGKAKNIPCVQLLGSGTILREAIAAAELLEKEFGVVCDIWSCPSFSQLRLDGFDAERWNRLHPMEKARKAHVTACLENRPGPVIAATDYVREFADQIRAFVPHGKRYVVLGTDGFGRSDTRANLRAFFEVDRYWIAHAAITALAADGLMNPEDVARAIKQWKLDPEKPNPLTV
jgi:pyruvate dehydrogenase E1 component